MTDGAKPAKPNNYAFIESQNVNLSIQAQGWRLDWMRFRSVVI
jgi:hypothetical protein